MKQRKPPWWIFATTTVLLTVILHECGVDKAVSSHRDQNARLRLELYEVTQARDDLRAKIELYSFDILKEERDSLAGLVAGMQEDLNRMSGREETMQEDLDAANEARIALELAVMELRVRDSILVLYNADWLVNYSLLEDSIRYYKQQLPPDAGIRPRTYQQSVGGLAAFLMLLHYLFRKRNR